jgi:hypothetical protein
MNTTPDLDSRLDEALEETFPASDPPAVHSIEPNELKPRPQPPEPPDAKNP